MKARLLATVALFVATIGVSQAQETAPVETTVPGSSNLPVNAPQGAVVRSLGGFYMWGQGGAWATNQQIRDQAPENVGNTPGSAQSPLSPDMPLPSASSQTTRGAVGYVMPGGTLSSAWGSNVRTEFGLSQTTANMPLAGSNGTSVYNGIALGGCSTCGGTSGYDATEMSAKAASDYKVGGVTLTPSITVFNSESTQNFNGGGVSSLGWRDTGAKVGLDSKMNLNKQLSLGIGGSYGVASREVSLSSADGGGGEASPYLANGEARVTYKPSDEFSLNGYAGLSNYDNRLPGVSSGGKVDYSAAGNAYYGAGATWRFGTK